ncbi:MAG: chemotaxis protein CheA [Phycisphaerales bacterium]|nr:MAG: chemotaxis protein CheA [Phycisphaerales bacterium]
MSAGGFDPQIIQDFLTECGELLEGLEGDLVSLESSPTDPDLLNQIFRALHTVKGSASFLALTNLVAIAHAAETALNAARTGRAVVDRPCMNMLLQTVDLLARQFQQLSAGEDLEAPDPALVEGLTAFGEGREAGAADTQTPAQAAAGTAPDGPLGARTTPIDLPADKMALVEFLAPDIRQTLDTINDSLVALANPDSRREAGEALAAASDDLVRSVDFFEFEPVTRLSTSLRDAASNIEDADEDAIAQIRPRLTALSLLLTLQADGIEQATLYDWPTDALIERLALVCAGKPLDEAHSLPADTDAEGALAFDGVLSGRPELADSPELKLADDASAEAAQGEDRGAKRPGAKQVIEQTIRVEVGRLESLMNLVGELVLQKNRVAALARRVGAAQKGDNDLCEQINASAEDLDRVTGDLQLAVMRTRMQPLDKIFGRYPRLIRDLADKTGKKINLKIVGGDTEVDKSVIEALGDPLVHLMRNSADHGLETPEQRGAAAKSPEGTIVLEASNQGSHVRILVRDDGRGLDRARIASKAVERGLATREEVDALPDRDVFRFIFEAGFSTVEQVSDLSGRGVGMDVVRTNIGKLNGSIDVSSTPGQGTTFTISIPLTVAIMQAMMVRVADEIYAIPLDNVVEILRPSDEMIYSIGDSPVLKTRGSVLPLISAFDAFEYPPERRTETPFVVILSVNERQIGLRVSELIGQQEIVIKPLEAVGRAGPLSGATVRDDGGVSLIIDASGLIRAAEGRKTPELQRAA